MASNSTPKFNPSTEPIDFDVLRLLEIDVADKYPEIMLELIDIFLSDSQIRMAGILPAIQEGDYRSVEISVHSLKSSAATFGAMNFSVYCVQMEQLIRPRQLDELQALLITTQEEFKRVAEVLSAERARWQEMVSG